MKKFLTIILLGFIICPLMVFADEYCANETVGEYCTGSSCLNSLQATYNTWSATGNTGRKCIRVIAKRTGNTKTYFSGKNPNSDYKCANGNTATVELKASGLSDSQTNVSECQSNTCYVPELWAVNCDSTSDTNSNTSNNNSSNIGTNDESSSNASNNQNVSTNSNGQIIGNTNQPDTGVETYFIILAIMVGLSYLILVVSKRNNKFKSI